MLGMNPASALASCMIDAKDVTLCKIISKAHRTPQDSLGQVRYSIDVATEFANRGDVTWP